MAEMGEQPRPILAVTSWTATPSLDRIAAPAAEFAYNTTSQHRKDKTELEAGRTLSRLLQHWTGPVLQWASATAKAAKARVERAATRANMMMSRGWCKSERAANVLRL